MTANRFDQLIDQWDATLRKAFLESVYRLRDQAQIDQIARMLERGDVEGAIRAVGLEPASLRPFGRSFEEAYEAGGNETALRLPTARRATARIQFNVRNPAAEQWLRENSGAMLRDVIEDQRAVARLILTAGSMEGKNPRSTALDLIGRINRATGRREGGIIGLTASQAEWVRRYEAELASEAPGAALARALRDKRFDAAVRRAQSTGAPVSADIRARMVTAYRNRALRYRAETISRTETMRALHAAQDEAIRQAVEAGGLQADQVTFTWHTARDRRVRDTHWAMNGDQVRMGQAFVTGSGARLRYPGDPNGPAAEVINCRCWREPRIDFLAGVR